MDEVAPRKIKYRIAGMEIFFLIFFALVADLISLIPLVGDVLGIIFWGFFTMYLLFIKGIRINTRIFVVEAIDIVAKAIPIIQELPEFSAGMVAIIFVMRAEDKLKSIQQKKATPLQAKSSPTRNNPAQTNSSPLRKSLEKNPEQTTA